MSREAGTRVVAIRDANDDVVNIYGRGVYVGDHVPDTEPFKSLEIKNPKIELDSGEVVWGFQCWWGAEARYESEFLKGRREETVPVP